MANAIPVSNAASQALNAALNQASTGNGKDKFQAPPGAVTSRVEHIGDGSNQNEYLTQPGVEVKLPDGTVREDR